MLYNPKWTSPDKFRSAWQLRITRAQRDALIKTLYWMESGLVRENDFNMSTWSQCIHGLCKWLTGVELPRGSGLWHRNLGKLFTPFLAFKSSSITVAQGAQALRNFLETGYPEWNIIQTESKHAA